MEGDFEIFLKMGILVFLWLGGFGGFWLLWLLWLLALVAFGFWWILVVSVGRVILRETFCKSSGICVSGCVALVTFGFCGFCGFWLLCRFWLLCGFWLV